MIALAVLSMIVVVIVTDTLTRKLTTNWIDDQLAKLDNKLKGVPRG